MSDVKLAIVLQPEGDPTASYCLTCEETLSLDSAMDAVVVHLQKCSDHIVAVEASIRRLVMVAQDAEVYGTAGTTQHVRGEKGLQFILATLNGFPADRVWDDFIVLLKPVEQHRKATDSPDERSWFVLPGGHKFTQDHPSAEWDYQGTGGQ